MKKHLLLYICLSVFFLGCSKDEWNNRNPYLPDLAVNVPINMSLPLYNKLQYAGNAVYVGGYGINGFFVINTGTGYRAFEATCSNHGVSSCSKLVLNGIEAKCSCNDGLVYNLLLGLPKTDAEYPLKEYRVSQSGMMLNVYN